VTFTEPSSEPGDAIVRDAPGSPDPDQRSGRGELAFAALMLGMLLAQLDGNIVVAALPSIASDLNAGTAIAGVTAAYLLTVTVTTPIAGKLGDLLGRRVVFVGSVLVFAAGSLAFALSGSMLELILARALQGVGGSGLIVTAISAMGELFDKTELVRRQIWLTASMAISRWPDRRWEGSCQRRGDGRPSSSSTSPSA